MLEVEGHHHLGQPHFTAGATKLSTLPAFLVTTTAPRGPGGNAMGTVTVQYVEKSRGKASIQRWVLSVKGGCVDRKSLQFPCTVSVPGVRA